MEDLLGHLILVIQLMNKEYIELKEKIEQVNDRISQMDYHIGLIQSNIDGGFLNKEGQPPFEEILQDFVLKKQALEQEKLALTNQG